VLLLLLLLLLPPPLMVVVVMVVVLVYANGRPIIPRRNQLAFYRRLVACQYADVCLCA
jgi:hypothetical protein